MGIYSYPMSGLILPVYYALLFSFYGVLIYVLGELNDEDYEVVRGILVKKDRGLAEVVAE